MKYFIAVFAFIAGMALGIGFTNDVLWKPQLIKNGCAEYDSKTGEFKLIDVEQTSQSPNKEE